MTNEKKKRVTVAWKAEAKRLEGLLVEVCGLIDPPDWEPASEALREWYAGHEDEQEANRAKLKASALAKLSGAEREALGLGEA